MLDLLSLLETDDLRLLIGQIKNLDEYKKKAASLAFQNLQYANRINDEVTTVALVGVGYLAAPAVLGINGVSVAAMYGKIMGDRFNKVIKLNDIHKELANSEIEISPKLLQHIDTVFDESFYLQYDNVVENGLATLENTKLYIKAWDNLANSLEIPHDQRFDKQEEIIGQDPQNIFLGTIALHAQHKAHIDGKDYTDDTVLKPIIKRIAADIAETQNARERPKATDHNHCIDPSMDTELEID